MCPFSVMEEYLPKKGTIVDFGCGEGVYTQYLARVSKHRNVIGIDSNKQKITLAKQSSKEISNIEFLNQNALSCSIRTISGATFSDFLHHMTYEDQLILLKKIAGKLKRDGVIVIKEINASSTIRSRLSRVWDFIFYPHDEIYYRSVSDWKKQLTKLGFSVKTKEDVLYFPGSTNILICTKK